MAHVTFRSGAQYLIGEIERIKKGDKFSIFCANISGQAVHSADELIVLIATEVANRQWWPELDQDQSVYRVNDVLIPAHRLIHSSTTNSGMEYATRIAKLEY